MEVMFMGEGNRNNIRKPPTCRQLLTNFATQCCIERVSVMVFNATFNNISVILWRSVFVVYRRWELIGNGLMSM